LTADKIRSRSIRIINEDWFGLAHYR
jgi:hypothetical protein